MLKEKLKQIEWELTVIPVIFILAVGIIYPLDRAVCENKANKVGLNWQYNLVTGCVVEKEKGLYVSWLTYKKEQDEKANKIIKNMPTMYK